jgi:hypothetical protein
LVRHSVDFIRKTLELDNYMRKYVHPAIFVVACVCLAVLFSSCAKKSRSQVYPVHGQVFDKNNKPAAGALVIFHPVDKNGPDSAKPIARVDEKGNYALTTYEKNDGGPEGEYIITIQWLQPPANPFGADKEGQDRLKGRYRDPKNSKLRFKIANQPDNAVPPIQL